MHTRVCILRARTRLQYGYSSQSSSTRVCIHVYAYSTTTKVCMHTSQYMHTYYLLCILETSTGRQNMYQLVCIREYAYPRVMHTTSVLCIEYYIVEVICTVPSMYNIMGTTRSEYGYDSYSRVVCIQLCICAYAYQSSSKYHQYGYINTYINTS